VGVTREYSGVKPSPELRKVEGPDSRTKAKGGTGTIQDIKDIPSGETRARPEILGKHLVHSGRSRVKPSPEPRKGEGPGSRTQAKGGTGTTILDILKDNPVERPEPVWKSWGSILFTRRTMVSVCRICAVMRAQSLWVRT
jgi:hypothetical protein